MSMDGADLVDSSPVTVRCQQHPEVTVTLRDRYVPDDGGVFFTIEAQAEGLHLCSGIELLRYDPEYLPDFLGRLAEDFRGWEGERVWETMTNDLAVRATFHSYGHVSLTWTLRGQTIDADIWEASVTTWQEAGEQMRALAADVGHFLRHGQDD